MQPCRTHQCAMMAWDPGTHPDGHIRALKMVTQPSSPTPGLVEVTTYIYEASASSARPRPILATALLHLRALSSQPLRATSFESALRRYPFALVAPALRLLTSTRFDHIDAHLAACLLCSATILLAFFSPWTSSTKTPSRSVRPSVADASSCLYDHTFFQKITSSSTRLTDIVRPYVTGLGLGLRGYLCLPPDNNDATTNTPTAAQASATVVRLCPLWRTPPTAHLTEGASSPRPLDLR